MKWAKVKYLESLKDEYIQKTIYHRTESPVLLVEIAVYVTLRLHHLWAFLILANALVLLI